MRREAAPPRRDSDQVGHFGRVAPVHEKNRHAVLDERAGLRDLVLASAGVLAEFYAGDRLSRRRT